MGPNGLWICGPHNQNFGWALANPTGRWALAHPAYHVAPPWVLGDAVSFPSGVRGGAPTAVAFCCIECFQNAFGCSIFRYFVSIAMRGKMKANPGSGRIWYLLATYAINIIHSRSNWQVNRQLLFTIKWKKKKERKENLTDLN